jgi:hypothetical protein
MADNATYSDVFSYLSLTDQTMENIFRFASKYPQGDPFKEVGYAVLGNWMRMFHLAHLFEVIDPDRSPLIRGAKDDPRMAALNEAILPISLSQDALGSAIIIYAWTAFETVSTDLWIAAANKRPMSIGLAVAKVSNQKGQSGKQQLYEPGKSIKLAALEKYGLDLREHMGDVIGERFNFGILDGLKDAYQRAFGEEGPIAKVFSDPDLAALHACRNILVHRGGYIDETFKSRIRQHTDLSTLAESGYLRADPDLTLRLVRCASQSINALVDSIQAWMEANPNP